MNEILSNKKPKIIKPKLVYSKPKENIKNNRLIIN